MTLTMRTGVISITIIALCFLVPAPAPADTVRVLDRNTDALQARLRMIDHASYSIKMAYYSVDDSRVSREIFAHLVQAAKRGVNVRVIVDACFNYLSGSRMRQLMACGIEFREYHPPCWLHPVRTVYRLHDKLLIGDDYSVILGGRNMEDHYFGVGSTQMFRDRDVWVTGQAAEHAAEYFEQIWDSKHVGKVPDTPTKAFLQHLHEPPRFKHAKRLTDGVIELGRASKALLCGDANPRNTPCTTLRPHDVWIPGVRDLSDQFIVPSGYVKFLHSSKVASEESDITDDLLKLINSARCRIVIETPYLLLTDRLQRAFQAAIQRGVTVQITTNSSENTDCCIAQAAYITQRGKLLRKGISIWEYQEPNMLHSKTWVVDDIVLIGSYNLDPRAALFDTQTCVLVFSPDLADALLSVMQNERDSLAVPIGTKDLTIPNSIQHGLRSPRAITTTLLRGLAPLIWYQL